MVNPLGTTQTFIQNSRVSGDFSFDVTSATPFGSGLRSVTVFDNGVGATGTTTATVQGDTLVISAVEQQSVSLGFIRDTIDLTLVFRQGFLNNAFPTSASFSDLVSSTFSVQTLNQTPRFEAVNASGALNGFGLRTGDAPGSAIFGRVQLSIVPSAVPEPATWGMMLIGFGAVGYSLRRARGRVAALA